MKHTIILLSGILFVGLASCKTKSKSQSSSSNATNTQTAANTSVTDKACAAEVSFGSYGTGIDGPTLDKVTALIDNKKLKSTSKNNGREGERVICLPLTELNESEKKDFIEQLKKIASAGQLVSVSTR